ncbi:MAG: hypothetical protein KF784_02255 [Fimbriimonadaceae bacterium]|nr:hypothetical protein [Fimbriimonadaceae bacterium]
MARGQRHHLKKLAEEALREALPSLRAIAVEGKTPAERMRAFDQLRRVGFDDEKLRAVKAETEAAAGELEKPICLWPEPYCEPCFESAWGFLCELQTWNEAAGEEQDFPQFDYLREFAREWWDACEAGRMLVVEKSRRMVVTWADRGLTLYRLGLRRTDWLLAGEDFEKAAAHVWRLRHYYENLQRRRPEWGLPDCFSLRYEGSRYLKQFGLTNGSICKAINSDPEGVRGDGVAGVTFEEASSYRELCSMVAQAKIITRNAAGQRNGFVCLIANASLSPDWQTVKGAG